MRKVKRHFKKGHIYRYVTNTWRTLWKDLPKKDSNPLVATSLGSVKDGFEFMAVGKCIRVERNRVAIMALGTQQEIMGWLMIKTDDRLADLKHFVEVKPEDSEE